jgi:hypothetical protein
MYRDPSSETARRGMILLVVITLLTLFALVGLAFVLYSESEATSSRIFREAQTDANDVFNFLRGLDRAYLINFGLGQVIYDVNDDQAGVSSAVRGWSLARDLYGWNDGFVTAGGNNPNTSPFSGTGRFHTDGSAGRPYLNPLNLDDVTLVNYTYFKADNFLRDPEHLYPNLAGGQQWRTALSGARGSYTAQANPPYTYPDTNHLFLAATRADGTVLTPSFHRAGLFGSLSDTTNPNWTNQQGKYLTLRPRQQEHDPTFTNPTDAGGDVQNLQGGTGFNGGVNDSIWIDLGYSVGNLPAPLADGATKYKALFAFLIRDLDGVVNVNRVGNIRYTGNGHASHQGWGVWEINPGQVLTLNPNPAPASPEWTNLFLHATYGRYGPDQQPGVAGTQAPSVANPPLATARFYSQFDYDAASQTNGNNNPSATLLSQLPTAATFTGATPYFSGFPNFQTNSGYDSAQVSAGNFDELTNHPLNYNYFNQAPSDDRVFNVSNLQSLLATYGAANTTWNTSPLGTALPTNLANARLRTLITTHSADLDRPGVAPFVWDPNDQSATTTRYQLMTTNADPGQWFPTGQPIPYPALTLRDSGGVPAGSEFNTPGAAQGAANIDWRAVSATLGRLDLSRTFQPYPAATNGLIDMTVAANQTQFTAAQSDRQQAAQQILKRLQAATGALDPTTAFNTYGATSPEYRGNRWLAQLAVNVIDFIDDDSNITPFNWYTRPDGTQEWVYGTELPRLVLNEIFVELDNDPNDPGVMNGNTQATRYNLNFWVELHNPLSTDSRLSDNGSARLNNNLYQVLLCQPNTNLRSPENVLGDPDNTGANQVYNAVQVYQAVSPYGTAMGQDQVLPATGKYSGPVGGNQGYYVLGASTAAGSYLVNAAPTNITSTYVPPAGGPNMTYSYMIPMGTNNTPPTPAQGGLTVMLRRLAHENLPFQPDPTKQWYNPYVTVDYVEKLAWQDGRLFDALGNHVPTPFNQRTASGRLQPYAAHSSQWVAQNPLPPRTGAGQVNHTFFRQNAQEDTTPIGSGASQTIKLPADWLVHLDRPIISPVELLSVSCYKPHELTQQFVTPPTPTGGTPPNGTPFQHIAPWTQPSTRLYRFLEWTAAHDRSSGGTGPGGRSVGKININTIYDPETFLALADAQSSNGFTAANIYNAANPSDTTTVYGQLMASRSPNLIATGQLGATDRPFRALSAGNTAVNDGQYPQGLGIDDTLLRNSTPGTPPPLFAVPGVTHPYLQNELLCKIFNNVTTRSNVFAVWCTVGFFEVRDDTTQPVKLGPEIGLAQGQNVRSRFFCIVDRTNLSLDPKNPRLQGPQPWFVTGNTAVTPAGVATVAVPALSGTYEGLPFNIQANSSLIVDIGTSNQETVTVTAVNSTANPPTFTATFANPHAAGFPITNVILGNPGPQPQFDYRNSPYTAVVKYLAYLN